MRPLPLPLCGLALLLSACPPPPVAVEAPPREVSVSATARINVVPDEATISLTFSSTAASMKKSHAASGQSVAAFTVAARALGVADSALELCGTTDDPNYR